MEHQIDKMVYKLYELTYDEVKIIDPEFGMSREEWEKSNVGVKISTVHYRTPL